MKKKPAKKTEPMIDQRFRQWTRGVSFTLAMGRGQVAALVALHASKGLPSDLGLPHIGFNHPRLRQWVVSVHGLGDRGLVLHFDRQDERAKRPVRTFSHPIHRTDFFSSNEPGRGVYQITEAGEAVVVLLKVGGIYQEILGEFTAHDEANGYAARRRLRA